MQHDLRAIYDRALIAEQLDGCARSAGIVVPLVMKLVRNIRSVVDVGCGTGVWLASFKDAGVPRALGLDCGIDQDQLEIEPDEFMVANLERHVDINEYFDLCLCLEVAERHADCTAAVIVRNLCKLSDVILFSAAIPGQGGNRHLNERWPSYWVELFASAGYEVVDTIRGRIWYDARIEWRYRQNLLLFANKAGVSRLVRSLGTSVLSAPLDMVHPACFEEYRRCSAPDETLAQKISTLERRNADLERDLQALVNNTCWRERRNADLERDLQAIVNSTSWKLTWPLRRVIGGDEKRRRRLRALARIGWRLANGKFLSRLQPKYPQPAS